MGFEVNRSNEVKSGYIQPEVQQNKVKDQAKNIDLHLDNKFKTEKGFDLLTETTASMLGAQFNLKPVKLSPVEHPEIKALSAKLSEYVGVPHISAEKAAEINRTADLAFAAKTIPNVGVSDEISSFEQRMDAFLHRLDKQFGIN